MVNTLENYYRCPETLLRLELRGSLSEQPGYFQFGEGVTCFGLGAFSPASSYSEASEDASKATGAEGGKLLLPFDATAIANNLRHERYPTVNHGRPTLATQSVARKLYYVVRPLLPVALRRHMQRFSLRNWHKVPFPRWPVDRTVDALHDRLLALAMKAAGKDEIPFIWFWPDGASGALIMTHDVETESGRRFCSTLMNIDDEFGLKASFQVVPEKRYSVAPSYLDSIRARGFEVNVQDLNHDGLLFDNREEFLRRVKKINQYGRDYDAKGFRAAVLYRRQEWFDDLEFSYDMSVPNVAHLDPQPGGCCTVMPYFIGNIVELPVTATQDYQLFFILGEYSIDLWKRQIDLILERNGLISFIVHPDYITTPRPQSVFKALLRYLAEIRSSRNVWTALPRDVDFWWRCRSQMRLMQNGSGWRIEGEGAGRARIAFAKLTGDRVVYSIASQAC